MAQAVILIIEDGTGVTNANSFATEAQLSAYAANRGTSIPVGTDLEKDAAAILLIKAMDYIRTLSFKGTPTEFAQALPFPRDDMFVNPADWCEEYPDDAIPPAVVEAQCAIALQIKLGINVTPTIVGGSFVKREKVGPLETEYSEAVNSFQFPVMPIVNGLLEPFIRYSFGLRTVRV